MEQQQIFPGGILTATTALANGWTYDDLATAVRQGRLERLAPGAYLPSEQWASLGASARHLAHARSLLLTRDVDWSLARRTAALAHGLDLLGAVPNRPQLLRPRTADERASSKHERVAQLPDLHRELVEGVSVTSVARTVVDLARETTFREAVLVADSALRLGLDPGELLSVLDYCASWPGVAKARKAIAFADGRAETALESISRVAMRVCRLPVFEPQVEVRVNGRLVARVDGFWREWNVVGECDGKLKYGGVEDLHAEKLRQDELDDLGLTVARWGWDVAWKPGQALTARIERARARAAGRRVDPRVTLVSTTLEQAQARARGKQRSQRAA